jgi:hypothetical protein
MRSVRSSGQAPPCRASHITDAAPWNDACATLLQDVHEHVPDLSGVLVRHTYTPAYLLVVSLSVSEPMRGP